MTDDPIRWLPHVHSLVFGPPLAIGRERLEPLLDGLRKAMFVRGSVEVPPLLADPSASPLATGNGDERPRGYRIEHGVALLPIHGVLASRVGQIAPDSTPLQSYEGLKGVLRNAQRDSRVRGILLDIDSPGGHAAGVYDLANQIRSASHSKPIWAIANHAALSAGYALAAAADRVWTTSSGELGSIGVVAVHRDQSEADAAEGLRYTYIYRGAHKIDGNPHAPLTTDAHMALLAEVDRHEGMLIDQLAQHRRIEPARLRATEARVYYGEQALVHGLADHVGTLDQAHAALVAHVRPQGRGTMSETSEGIGFSEAAAVPDDNIVQLRVDAAVKAELERCSAIAALCNLHHVPDMIQALQADRSISVDRAASQILDRKAQDDLRRQITAVDTTMVQQRTLGVQVEEAAKARFAAQRRGLYSNGE